MQTGKRITIHGNPRSNKKGQISEHIFIAGKILGKPLPIKAVIHHPYGRYNNRIFIICQNQAYHNLLERRTRALKECGNVRWRRCLYCKSYDDPKNMTIHSKPEQSYCHKKCRDDHNHIYYRMSQ